MDGEAEALVRKAIDLALAGNVRLLKTFVELLIAKPKGNPVVLEVEPGRESDPMALLEAGMRALCAGEISPADALPIARFAESAGRLREREEMGKLRQEEATPTTRESDLGRRSARAMQKAAPAAKPDPAAQPVNDLYSETSRSDVAVAAAPANRLYPPREDAPALAASGRRQAAAAPVNRLYPPSWRGGRAAWLASASPLAFTAGTGLSHAPVARKAA